MKILITGGTGLVGSTFVELTKDKFEVVAPTSEELDISDPSQIEKAVLDKKPDVFINLGAFTNVDGAQDQSDDEGGTVYKINALAPANIAGICKQNNIHFIQISTDYVFDGKKENEPYKEDDKTGAINWYGKTKQYGEEFVADSGCDFSIVRIEMPYSAKYDIKSDFARFFMNGLKEGKEIKAVNDQKITPVFVDCAVMAIAKIAEEKTFGVYHVASTDATSPYDFAGMLAGQLNLDKSLIHAISFEEFNSNRKASRPKNSWLSVSKFEEKFGKGILMSNLESIELFKSF